MRSKGEIHWSATARFARETAEAGMSSGCGEVMRTIATLVLMQLLLPAGTGAQQRFEILGGAVELPAPVRDAPEEGGKKCEPRSPWLTPMLVGHTALHIGDAYSSRRAIEAGANEANPLMRWAVTSDARAYTVKGGGAAVIWWLIDRDACKRPQRALWTAIVLSAVQGFVVQHNYREGTRFLEVR